MKGRLDVEIVKAYLMIVYHSPSGRIPLGVKRICNYRPYIFVSFPY